MSSYRRLVMLEWLNENREWLFSGAGAVVLGWIGTRFFKGREKEKGGQSITSGENSKNYQSGRDINISGKGDEK